MSGQWKETTIITRAERWRKHIKKWKLKRRKITILWRVKIHHLFSDKHFWRLGRETLLATSQLLSRRLRIQSCKLSLKTVYFWWQPLTNTITGFKRIKNPAHFQKSRQEFFFFPITWMSGLTVGTDQVWKKIDLEPNQTHSTIQKPNSLNKQHSLKFQQGKLSRGFTVLLYRPVT